MNSFNLKPFWGLLCLFLFNLSFISGQIIFGSVTNEEGEGIEGVEVFLSCTSDYWVLTDASGGFNFENVPEGDLCSIGVFLDGSVLNGVSIYDIVLMSKHILGTQLLDSPYKMIAADVDNNGVITVADIIDILEVDFVFSDEFPNNSSWRFIPADFIFPDPTNPWATELPEITNVLLAGNNVEINFIAIKIGDVNNSANPD